VSSLPVPMLVLIFLAAAAAIWVAGIRLSDQTDGLSERLHLGSALAVLIPVIWVTGQLLLQRAGNSLPP